MYVLKGGAPGAEKEATPEELKQSEDAALALLTKANLGGPGPGSSQKKVRLKSADSSCWRSMPKTTAPAGN